MSMMSSLIFDLQEEVQAQELTFSQIAEKFNVPLDWVEEVAEELDRFYEGDNEW